jgi:Holliday junction resolvase-like predicted endonuclease
MPSKTRFKSGLKINVSRQRTVIKSRLEVKSEYLNFGARAEALTRSEGERRGLKWVASNVRYRAGELDVVMIDFARREWVFVEVRARRSRDWRSPLEWVSVPKILKLRRAIAIYLEGPEARAWTAQMHLRSVRLDLVAVVSEREMGEGAPEKENGELRAPRFEWFENFSPL